MSILNWKIFKLVEPEDYVYNIDETSLLSDMNKSISSLLSVIDMENNIMLSSGVNPV